MNVSRISVVSCEPHYLANEHFAHWLRHNARGNKSMSWLSQMTAGYQEGLESDQGQAKPAEMCARLLARSGQAFARQLIGVWKGAQHQDNVVLEFYFGG